MVDSGGLWTPPEDELGEALQTAQVLIEEGRADEAGPYQQRVIELARERAEGHPNHYEAKHLMAATQYELAGSLNASGRHDEALAAAQAALGHKHEPADEGWAYYNVATAQEKLGRAEEARAAYAASIRAYNQPGRTLDPDDLYLMGNAYLRLDQDPAAVKAFQQAIKVRPDFPQARYNLGVAYFALGNRKGAQDEYNALRRLDPARAAKLQAIISGKPGRK